MSVPYSISPTHADALMGIVALQADVRRVALDRLLGGRAEVIDLFSEFIGLAKSVIENNREMAELVLITEGGLPPNQAEKINLPTLFGALNGVRLADGIDPAGTCEGCAFRLGTCANQSPITTFDASDCREPGEPVFMCHEDLTEGGVPTRACAGFAKARVAAKAAISEAAA